METKKSEDWVRGLSDVDLRRLQVFRTVADRSGISNAQAELNLGASAISRYIKEIEEKLGLRLCYRGRAGFSLTREGKQVYELTGKLLGAVDDFRLEVSTLHETLVGTLRIACLDNLGEPTVTRLANSLRSFAAAWPSMSVEVDTLSPPDISQRVIDGYYHAGVSYLVDDDSSARLLPSLNYQLLYREDLDWYCGQGHELFDQARPVVTAASVDQFEWTLGGYSRHVIELLESRGGRIIMPENTVESRLIVLLAGQYIGRVPNYLAQLHLKAGRLKKVTVPNFLQFPRNRIVAITRARSAAERIVQLILDHLTRAFAGDN